MFQPARASQSNAGEKKAWVHRQEGAMKEARERMQRMGQQIEHMHASQLRIEHEVRAWLKCPGREGVQEGEQEEVSGMGCGGRG